MNNYSPECIISNDLLVVEEVPITYTWLISGASYLSFGSMKANEEWETNTGNIPVIFASHRTLLFKTNLSILNNIQTTKERKKKHMTIFLM